MFNVSFGEILAFGVIALLILGPEKFPQALRQAIQKYRHFKNLLQKVQQDIEQELELAELKNFMATELQRIKDNEAQLQATLIEMQSKIDQQQQALTQHNIELTNLYQPYRLKIQAPLRPTSLQPYAVKKYDDNLKYDRS